MKILVLLSVLLMTGCSLFNPPVKLRTETVDVLKPILYCPAPAWDELEVPSLATDFITDDMEAGEVAQRYRAAIIQLQGHIELLQTTLEQYDTTNEAYKEVEAEFLKQLERGDFDINTEESEPSE